jgi:hypothetical protein
MVKKIRVSRQGLTRCPSCKNHIKVAAPINKTICSFCETSLAESLGTATGEVILGTRMVAGGSRAVLAATLLGLPLAACSTSEPVNEDIVVDAGYPDLSSQPLYGVPMDWEEPPLDQGAGTDEGTLDPGVAQPPYGIPMDMMSPPQDEGTPDPGVIQPPYGIPMDMMDPPKEEDAGTDAEATPDENAMPVYGLPPEGSG